MFPTGFQKYFQTRSKERDAESDRRAVQRINAAIQQSRDELENERNGIELRMKDAILCASMAVGNACDEYLTRSPAKRDQLLKFEKQLREGERRIEAINSVLARIQSASQVFSESVPAQTESLAPDRSSVLRIIPQP